jgi:hypothetical protein
VPGCGEVLLRVWREAVVAFSLVRCVNAGGFDGT